MTSTTLYPRTARRSWTGSSRLGSTACVRRRRRRATYFVNATPSPYRSPLVLPGGRGAGERDPSGFVAESTWLYPPRRYGTLTALIETPAWCVPAVSEARTVVDPEREIARVARCCWGRPGS
ncbi:MULTISPECIES: hypothetical protein [Streptomyces]|uniref:hypothetical protein n=1 Tax=Streptomyces TaxID=1883 RepID=UPI001F0BA4FB|nr:MULTISPECIES: hypothetical protein [Streptomyces]